METKTKTNTLQPRLISFTVDVLRLAKKYESNRTLAPVFNQLLRSAGSVGANITEAHGSVTKGGFARYFHIALQSANETRYWLDVLQEYGVGALDTFKKENNEFCRVIGASLRTLRSKS